MHYYCILIASILSIFCISTVLIVKTNAEEECLKSRVWCYDCESWTDPRCSDPFNLTVDPINLPPLKICEGCCVKIVMNKDTPHQSIRRTCTTNIQINLFMVDHVCMEESDGNGRMCFCENDACNKANHLDINIMSFIKLYALVITFIITII